jgi:hypothetical protein
MSRASCPVFKLRIIVQQTLNRVSESCVIVYIDRYPASGSVRRRNALDLTRDIRDDQRQVQLRRFNE